MSLRVWLPLNGNLNNQGTSGVTVTNSNATVDSTGKIGSCYRFNKNAYLSIPGSAVTSFTTECSVSLWLKLNSFNAAYDTYFQIGIDTSPWTSYRMGLLRSNSASTLTFVISDGSTSTQNSFTTPAMSTGVWTHLTLVYKTGHCLIYVNGALHADNTTTVVPKFSDVTKIMIGGLSGSYKSDSYINDFRIYDHALSPKEVKEISKGLVLHYPLDGSGKGGDNLVPNQSVYNSLDTALTRTSSSTDGWYWLPNSHFIVEPSTTYTLSVCSDGTISNTHAQSASASTKSFSMWLYLCNSNTTKDYNNGGYDNPICFLSNNYNHQQIGNKHIWQYTTTASQTHMSIRVNTYSNGTDATTVKFWQIKVEKGSVATSWCPNSADSAYTTLGYNSNIEVDTSGYKNNGTRSGTLTSDNDTAKYNTATIFSSNSHISTTLNAVGYTNTYTFAWWGKITNYNNTMMWGFANGNRLNLYMSGGNFYWNTGDGANNPFSGVSSTTYGDGNWHHFAVSGDGTASKLYIDGVFKANSKTYKGITGTSLIFNGWEISTGYNFNGSLSDFRLYATALSADDIKELYQSSAFVTNNGSIMCYDFNEQ